MFDIKLIIMILLGGDILAVAGVVAWIVVRARLREQQWQRAWALVERSPESALTIFQEMQFARHWRSDIERLARLYVGKALCLVKLGRFSEAKEAEEEARAIGPIGEADQTRLIKAYLSHPHDELPDNSLEALAKGLLLPETVCDAETRATIEKRIRARLSTAAGDDAPRLGQVIALGKRLTDSFPGL